MVDVSMDVDVGLAASAITTSSDGGRLDRAISIGRMTGGRRGTTPPPPPPLPPAIRSLRGPEGGANGFTPRLRVADGPLGGAILNEMGRGKVYGFVDGDADGRVFDVGVDVDVDVDIDCSSSLGFLDGGGGDDDDDGDDEDSGVRVAEVSALGIGRPSLSSFRARFDSMNREGGGLFPIFPSEELAPLGILP